MAELTLKSRIVFRKDTAANWSTRNPILKTGEPGWDSSNKRLKVGNNTLAWSDLEWAFPDPKRYKDTELILGSDIYSGIGRIGTNGNILELSAFGFDFNLDKTSLHIGEYGDFYADSSTKLGLNTNPWDSVYSNKYLSGSNTAMTFGFADGTTAFSVGRSPEAIVPGIAKNLGIKDNSWSSLSVGDSSSNGTAVLTATSFTIGSGSGASESTVNTDRTFTIWNKLIGPGPGGSYTWRNDVAIRTGCNTGGMYYDKTYIFAADKGFYATKMSGDNGANSVNGLNLGTSENPWNKLYLGDMQLSYNSTEEAIEFLAN